MAWIIGIVILLIVLGIAIQHWYVIVAIIALVVVINRDRQARQEQAGREYAERQRKMEEDANLRRHVEEQRGYYKQMSSLADESVSLFEALPKYLTLAEEFLDQSEIDFAENAFSPFWDSIENAAKTLGHFDENIHRIQENSSRYLELVKKYEGKVAKFPIAGESAIKLNIARFTAERMQTIVRTAQRNFQFATIYEHRKTNQILVAGFTNLAQALDQMTFQITSSISQLGMSVDSVASALDKVHSKIDLIAIQDRDHHEKLMADASKRTTREKRALTMLDNIQRGRPPSLLDP